jgi:GT2 family glycosyltransferase
VSPLISVVIPTHNRRHLLARTLATAQQQRDVDLEIVVVDDGSTDGTSEWLAGVDDSRLTIRRHPEPRGVAHARNTGVDAAAGEWVAFHDDDDLWAPDKLAEQLAAVAAGDFGWSCTGAVNVDDRLRVLRPDRPPAPDCDVAAELLQFNAIPGGGSGVLARTELVRALGGFDPELKRGGIEDWELWIRLALRAPLASVARPLVAYVIHSGGRSRDVRGTEADIAYLTAKHHDEMTRRGVAPKLDHWLGYMAQLEARSGRRLPALRLHARIFARYRHWSWLPGAAGIVLWPASVRVGDLRARRRMPSGWADEVERWLAPLRSTPGVGADA